MASLDDILSAAKNIAQALNNVAQTWVNNAGARSAVSITATTVVKSGQGRLVTIIVVVAGSGPGTVYDAGVMIPIPTAAIYTIPATLGVYPINLPVNYGITVTPGTGQTIVVGFT